MTGPALGRVGAGAEKSGAGTLVVARDGVSCGKGTIFYCF